MLDDEEFVCPICDSSSLLEDNGLECPECGWKEENTEIEEEEEN